MPIGPFFNTVESIRQTKPKARPCHIAHELLRQWLYTAKAFNDEERLQVLFFVLGQKIKRPAMQKKLLELVKVRFEVLFLAAVVEVVLFNVVKVVVAQE